MKTSHTSKKKKNIILEPTNNKTLPNKIIRLKFNTVIDFGENEYIQLVNFELVSYLVYTL